MAAVTNKTGKPLSIPLPRGKTLHLGPRKSGQISAHDIDHPGLKKLVDAGAIEILAEDSGSTGAEGGGTHGRGPTPAHTAAVAVGAAATAEKSVLIRRRGAEGSRWELAGSRDNRHPVLARVG